MNKKCLYPPCKNDAFERGLCKSHHVHARKLVKDRKTNWETLIQMGKADNATERLSALTTWFLEKPPFTLPDCLIQSGDSSKTAATSL